MEGIVLKAYGGFFYVQADHQVWECRPRGRFKKERQTILAGDHVKISETGEDTGVVEEVKPRRTELIRPPIANVDQVLVVFAVTDPSPNFALLDRILINAHIAQVQPIICFNKWDLLQDEFAAAQAYQEAGYQVIKVSAKKGNEIEPIQQVLKDRVSVFAGPSGVGKSTLLNAIQPGLNLKTGAISEKVKRGKHTTRHVELVPLRAGGWVADAPGFSSLNLPDLAKEEVTNYFPEIQEYAFNCRFNGCSHRQEPGCAVLAAVASGELNQRRYEQYLTVWTELNEQKERRY